MKVAFLLDNKTEDTCCEAEWGLSLLLEAGGHKVMYDTGASHMFYKNAKAMKENLEDVECLMISHGHYDHTNGIDKFCEVNKTAKVYMHKDGFYKEYVELDNGKPDLNDECGVMLPTEFFDRIEAEGRLIKTSGITKINECMDLISEIPTPEGFKPTERFCHIVDGQVKYDEMNHEQFLAVKEGKRLHIVSGCSHKGALATIMYAKKLYPDYEIASYIGGLHTYNLKRSEREEFCEKLKELGVKKVAPLHCTGINMIITLKEKLDDACIVACAGDRAEV